MCGIIGYTGEKQAAPILLEGLENLEYRGYDSAGIAVNTGDDISVVKAQGRLAVLKENAGYTHKPIGGNCRHPGSAERS